jgi:hypothetical protein
MQTFLPYASFWSSAKVLDYRRLGKQRVECKQILKALGVSLDPPTSKRGWSSHPATLMWKGCEKSLCRYAITICEEWIKRGYNDTLLPQFQAMVARFEGQAYIAPDWLGDPAFHASHRSNLLRKDFTFYSQYGWTEPPTLEYIWPTKTYEKV